MSELRLKMYPREGYGAGSYPLYRAVQENGWTPCWDHTHPSPEAAVNHFRELAGPSKEDAR